MCLFVSILQMYVTKFKKSTHKEPGLRKSEAKITSKHANMVQTAILFVPNLVFCVDQSQSLNRQAYLYH